MGAQTSNTTGRNTEKPSYKSGQGARILHTAVVVDFYSNPATMTFENTVMIDGELTDNIAQIKRVN